jgi:hypothetical protein
MIESQIEEMWASVTEVPPSNVGVVEVKSPAISWSFTNAVKLITNSRKLRVVELRSSAERLSMATRFGLNSSMIFFIRMRWFSSGITSG